MAMDDAYMSETDGYGTQPEDKASVIAGFVATIRAHMILEKT